MASAEIPAGATDRRSRVLLSESSTFRRVDGILLFAAVALAILGLLMVYSATHRSLQAFGQSPTYYLKRQGMFLVVGLAAAIVTALIDYRVFRIYAAFFYLGSLGLLVLVRTPLGSSALGAQRWFQLAGFQFSPSLFARLALIVMLAAFLSNLKGDVTLRQVLRAVVIGVIPMFLVFIQPDIGTSIILAAILVSLLVISGARARHLAVLALVAALTLFGAFQMGVVKSYQVQRLTSFLDSSKDLQRANYNKNQAEIAIGAGGLTGKGYLHGSQTNLDFVPEQHTDFIFTVVGEELGFIGSLVLLGLFGLLLWRGFRIALLAKDPFGTFVAVGVVAMISIQLFVNVGMTIGIMPITGIPLPFVSYGGSALIADFIGIGLLEGIHIRHSL